jgi:hypothetical protein
MLVSKNTFLEALIETKERQIIIQTIFKSGVVSKQRFRIGELTKHNDGYGEATSVLILVPLSDDPVLVIDFKRLFGIKLEQSVSIHGHSADELVSDSAELAAALPVT